MLGPDIASAHRSRSRDAHPPAVTDPEIRSGFFGGSGRLESPPLERNRRPLEATPQRIGAAVDTALGQLDERRDHASPAPPAPPTSPPTPPPPLRPAGAPSRPGSGSRRAPPRPPPP